jgi:hypothetical protein
MRPIVKLLVLVNDVTFRNPSRTACQGWLFHPKPASAFAIRDHADELARAARGRVHRAERAERGAVGDPDAGPEMHFSFFDLIAHITKTRASRRHRVGAARFERRSHAGVLPRRTAHANRGQGARDALPRAGDRGDRDATRMAPACSTSSSRVVAA